MHKHKCPMGYVLPWEQAYLSLYCDMGALLNYKALLTAGTDVALAMGKDIQVQGMEYATEVTEQIASSPVRIQDVKLFNPQGGFTSFLIPAVLILVVQQSLLLGVGTMTGTERDRRRKGLLLPKISISVVRCEWFWGRPSLICPFIS